MEDGMSCFKAFNSCEFPVCTAWGTKQQCEGGSCYLRGKKKGLSLGFICIN